MSHRFTLSLLVALALGCQSSNAANDTPPQPDQKPMADDAKQPIGVPEGWQLVPKATYTASQTPDEVIIKATGENNTGGYQTKLVMSPLRIFPPQWLLVRKPPEGPAIQVISPFEVTASFKAKDKIDRVVVTDGAGKHEVKVDQARD